MAARSKARKRALDILYEAELRGTAAVEVLRDGIGRIHPVSDYTVTLVEGVEAHRERIDELLETYAIGWTLDRMPAVDRNVLRLGTYELLWVDDVPDGVAINEAVLLVSELSTEGSPHFVNGLLARLVHTRESPSM